MRMLGVGQLVIKCFKIQKFKYFSLKNAFRKIPFNSKTVFHNSFMLFSKNFTCYTYTYLSHPSYICVWEVDCDDR